jgi:DNA (cytosine-5)-methyltransferase 1
MHKGMNSDCNEGQTPVLQPTYGIPGNWIGRKPENGGNAVEPMHNIAPCLTSTDRHGAVYAPAEIGPCMGASGPPYSRTGNERVESEALAIHNMAVRRLTPVECERLQGFPDEYTNIKDKCPDSPRYKALGNSWAVPVVRWIGERIDALA